MSRLRTLPGPLLLAIVSFALVAGGLPPSSAAPTTASKIIRGLVADQSGRLVDDVQVEAIDADGVVAASALTYASEKVDGVQHGFYGLHVAAGTYTLRFSKPGFRTQTVTDAVTTGRRQVARAAEVALAVVRAPSTTDARLADTTIRPTQRGKVLVTVKGKASSIVGEIEVLSGRRVVGSGALRKRDHGKTTIDLKRFDRGSHRLTVAFAGSTLLKPSADGVLLKVTRTGRRPIVLRPNAW